MLTPNLRTVTIASFLTLLVLDQTTKHLALALLQWGQSIEVLPIFKFTLAFNEGIGMSMLSGLNDLLGKYSQLVFGIVNLGISGAIVYMFRNETRLFPAIGWTMVVAGAVGNAIDRFIALGSWRTGVVDFLHAHWANTYNFPVFNLADCAITLGFVVVLIDMLFLDRPERSAN